MSDVKWVPRSGADRGAGCMWLARMIDKARRYEAQGVAPGEMLGEYMFGDRDYMDAKVLGFLRLRAADVAETVRAEPDDERAAQRILERSGTSADRVAEFNRKFARANGLFLSMMDADEGRRKPGLATSVMKAVYNAVIFPLGLRMFRPTAKNGTR